MERASPGKNHELDSHTTRHSRPHSDRPVLYLVEASLMSDVKGIVLVDELNGKNEVKR